MNFTEIIKNIDETYFIMTLNLYDQNVFQTNFSKLIVNPDKIISYES